MSVRIRHIVLTAWVSRSHPGREWSLHFPPQKAAACGTLLGWQCHPACHRVPLQLSELLPAALHRMLDGSGCWVREQTDVPSQPLLLLLIIKTLSDAGSLFLQCVGPTGTIGGLLCTSWVISISKPLPNGVAGSQGSSGARHHTHPIPDITLSLSISLTSHSNIIP